MFKMLKCNTYKYCYFQNINYIQVNTAYELFFYVTSLLSNITNKYSHFYIIQK